MPSLRQKVTTYFRQLSFIAEPRDGGIRNGRGAGKGGAHNDNDDDGNFIIKYLEGRMERHYTTPPPDILSGRDASELPAFPLATYQCGPQTITAASTGPDEGLCGIKRSKLHLSASYADDIDFIDTNDDDDDGGIDNARNSVTKGSGATPTSGSVRSGSKQQRPLGSRKMSNGSLTGSGIGSGGSDQNANKLIGGSAGSGMRSRKNSRTSISNMKESGTRSMTAKTSASESKGAPGKSTTIVVSMVSTSPKASDTSSSHQNINRNVVGGGGGTSSKIEKKSAPTSTTTNKSVSGDATTKVLEATTENLLRAAMSNDATASIVTSTVASNAPSKGSAGPLKALSHGVTSTSPEDMIAGVGNWQLEADFAYGVSVSLYEMNQLTKTPMGNPIADCYGVVARGDAAIMALADGVNWGDGARLAARSAVHGCLDYLDRALFGQTLECRATDTREVFVSLLRSLWEGHGCILEVGGALSTLTVAVVLPLLQQSTIDGDKEEEDSALQDKENIGLLGNNGEGERRQRYVVCACNVGDSLGYVYSQKYGVREFTQASHDISSMRDMRDALGALGPADGNQPELSNLTLSLTIVESGDIVFLTSDGVSDNFDPVVGKFAEAWTPDVQLMASSVGGRGTNTGGSNSLAPKRQNKSASALYARLHRNDANGGAQQRSSKQRAASPSPPSSSSSAVSGPPTAAPSRPKYMRSHTVIEPRRLSNAGSNQSAAIAVASPPPVMRRLLVPRSAAGLPLVTGPQRHALTLHRLEDMLSYGINGTFSPCVSARRLCQLLMDFVRMMTTARRKTLEQRELFYKLATGPDGVRREVALNRLQHRAARKRVVDSSAFVALPGKLDHATLVAYVAGGGTSNGSFNGSGNSTTGVVDAGGNSNQSDNNGLHFTSPRRAPLKSQEFYETNF